MPTMIGFFQFACLFVLKKIVINFRKVLVSFDFCVLLRKQDSFFSIYSYFIFSIWKVAKHLQVYCLLYATKFIQQLKCSDCCYKFNICSQLLHVDIRDNVKLHFPYHGKVWPDSCPMRSNALTTDTLINSWIFAVELYLVCCVGSCFRHTYTILCRSICLLPFVSLFASSPNGGDKWKPFQWRIQLSFLSTVSSTWDFPMISVIFGWTQSSFVPTFQELRSAPAVTVDKSLEVLW